jgi:hypothetical protein
VRRLGVNLRLSDYPMLSCLRSCRGTLFVTCRDFPAVSVVTGRDFPAVSLVTDRDFPAVSVDTGRDRKTFLAWGNVNKLYGRRKNVPVSTAGLFSLGIVIF